MVDDCLEREVIRARLQRFLGDVIEKAGGPKAVSLELKKMGFEGREGQFDDRTVRAWRTGGRMPTPDVVLAMAARYDVSLDRYAMGTALETSFADQVARLAGRLDRLEGRLHAWEIEWAAAAGQEPPESFEAGGPISLADHAFRRRVEELEKAVQRLRDQQA